MAHDIDALEREAVEDDAPRLRDLAAITAEYAAHAEARARTARARAEAAEAQAVEAREHAATVARWRAINDEWLRTH